MSICIEKNESLCFGFNARSDKDELSFKSEIIDIRTQRVKESKYINVLSDAFILFSDENLKKFHEDISKGCKFSINKFQQGGINVVQIPQIDVRYYDEYGVRHYIMSNDCRRHFLRTQKLLGEILNM